MENNSLTELPPDQVPADISATGDRLQQESSGKAPASFMDRLRGAWQNLRQGGLLAPEARPSPAPGELSEDQVPPDIKAAADKLSASQPQEVNPVEVFSDKQLVDLANKKMFEVYEHIDKHPKDLYDPEKARKLAKVSADLYRQNNFKYWFTDVEHPDPSLLHAGMKLFEKAWDATKGIATGVYYQGQNLGAPVTVAMADRPEVFLSPTAAATKLAADLVTPKGRQKVKEEVQYVQKSMAEVGAASETSLRSLDKWTDEVDSAITRKLWGITPKVIKRGITRIDLARGGVEELKKRDEIREPLPEKEADELRFLAKNIAERRIAQEAARGHGPFMQMIGGAVIQGLEDEGVGPSMDRINELAKGDLATLWAFGKGFELARAATPGVVGEGIKAAERGAATAAKATTGTGIAVAGKVAETAGKAIETVAPAVTPAAAVATAVTTGSFWPLITAASGRISGITRAVTKTGEKISEAGAGVADFGKQIAGSAPAGVAARTTRAIMDAVPVALSESTKGAAIDALFPLVAGSPAEAEESGAMALGLGSIHGGLRGAKRWAGAQQFAPEWWKNPGEWAKPIAPDASFSELAELHGKAMQEAPPQVQKRINAVLNFFNKAAGVTRVYLLPEAEYEAVPALTRLFLKSDPSLTHEQAVQKATFTASQQGSHITSLVNTAGQRQNVMIFRKPDAAPHETLHGLEALLGEKGSDALDMTVARQYAPFWESFGDYYVSRMVGPAKYAEYLRDPRFSQGGWREVWREVAGKQGDETWNPDKKLAQEGVADNFATLLKSGQLTGRPEGIPDTIARTLTSVLAKMGVDPLSEQPRESLGLPPSVEVMSAIKETPGLRVEARPVVEPAKPGPASPDSPEGRAKAADYAKKVAETVKARGDASDAEKIGIIAEGIASSTPVAVDYSSATATPGVSSGGMSAAIEAARAARREVIERARGLSPEQRATIEKQFDPIRVIQTKAGKIQFEGHPLDALAANLQRIAEALTKSKRTDLSAFEIDPATGSYTTTAWDQILTKFDDYNFNQRNGWTGAGLARLGQVSGERGYYTPPEGAPARPLDANPVRAQEMADFFNYALNYRLADTPRITGGKLPLGEFGRKVAEQTDPSRVTPPAPRIVTGEGGVKSLVERKKFGEPTATKGHREAAEKLGLTGQQIMERNPTRFKIEDALGVDRPELFEALQHINLEYVRDVQLAPMLKSQRGNIVAREAGHLPPELPRDWEGSKIEESRNFQGPFGGAGTGEAYDIASKLKTPEQLEGYFQAARASQAKSTRMIAEAKASGDFSELMEAMRESIRGQLYREVFEAATKSGSAYDIETKYPAFKAKFPELAKSVLEKGDLESSHLPPERISDWEPKRPTRKDVKGLVLRRGAPEVSKGAVTSAGRELEAQGFRISHRGGPNNREIIIQDSEGRAVGGVETHRAGQDSAWVDLISIDKHLQGRGVGNAIFREAMSDLQADGVEWVRGHLVSPWPVRIREKVFGAGKTKYLVDEEPATAAEAEKAGRVYTDIDDVIDVKGRKAAFEEVRSIDATSRITPESKFMPKESDKIPQTFEESKAGGRIMFREGWLDPNGVFHSLISNQSTHELWARKFLLGQPKAGGALAEMEGGVTASNQLYRQGWQRFVPYGSDGAMLNNVKGKPLTRAQRAAVFEWADTSEGLRLVKTDNGNEYATIWPAEKPAERIAAESVTRFRALPDIEYLPPKDKSKEYIDKAAIKMPDGKLFTGAWHAQAMDEASQAGYTNFSNAWDGFITSKGRFVLRGEAYDIAEAANQIQAKKYAEVFQEGTDRPVDTRPGLESASFESTRQFLPPEDKQGDKSYALAEKRAGNPLVRQTESPDNTGRTLLVQISSKLINKGEAADKASAYYDKLYSGAREGFARMDDFWEIPQWMGFAAKLFPNSDVYVVRDVAAAQKFLADAKYDRVAFSVLDTNKGIIKEVIKDYEGKVDMGGYVEPKEFQGRNNVTWHASMKDWAKDAGVPFVDGVDYRHFEGSQSIPRLTMSTGCKHKCAFCTVTKALKSTPQEVVEQQADAIAKLGTKLVYLNDKTFGQADNYQTLSDVYQRIKEQNPEFQGFIVQTTASELAKGLSEEWLKTSGIKFVELGIESYNDPILNEMKKPATTSLIDRAVDKLRKNGIALIPNIIIGFPQETQATYARTLDFLKQNKDIISHANIYNLALYENTEMGKKMTTASEGDFNENVLEKSFHSNPEVHRQFAGDLYGEANKMVEQQMLPEPTKEEFRIAADERAKTLRAKADSLKAAFEKDANYPLESHAARQFHLAEAEAKWAEDISTPLNKRTEQQRLPPDEAFLPKKPQDIEDATELWSKAVAAEDVAKRREIPVEAAAAKDRPAFKEPPESGFMPAPSNKKERAARWKLGRPGNGFSHTWIDPKGNPIHLGGEFHHDYFGDNLDQAKKYGIKIPMVQSRSGSGQVPDARSNVDGIRADALKAGFARVIYAQNGGRLTVEARNTDWPKLKDSVEELVARNIDSIDSMTVTLFNDRITSVVKSDSERLFMLDSDKEKMANLPLLTKQTEAQAQGGIAAESVTRFRALPDLEYLPKKSSAEFKETLEKIRTGDLFGATFNRDGTRWEPENEKVFLVSLASKNIERSKLTAQTYKKFEDSYGAIADDANVVSGIFAFEKGGKQMVSLDLNAIIPAALKKLAIEFARANNQISIWDQARGTEIKTGGTGDTRIKTPEQAKKALDNLMAGEEPNVDQITGVKTLTQPDLLSVAPSGRPKFERAGRMTQEELKDRYPEAVVPKKQGTALDNALQTAPLLDGAFTESEKVSRYAKKLADFYRERQADPDIAFAKNWYNRITPLLGKLFGKYAGLFTELLAATSPNTMASVNVTYALRALTLYKSGEFKRNILGYEDGLKALEDGRAEKLYNTDLEAGKVSNPPETPSDATFMSQWIEHYDLKPRDINGKLFGMHSTRVLAVLSRRWLTKSKDAPGLKVSQFVKNLLGIDDGATIDVWAGRTMRRMGYEGLEDRWRILPENSTAISDSDFVFSQKAFEAAAKEVGLKPSELQAALWFAEKKVWAENGWGNLDLGDFYTEIKNQAPEVARRLALEKAQMKLDIEPRKK